MATGTRDDSSDYESSCSSSVTVPESSRSWLSNLSFISRQSSISGDPHLKPHKACLTAWQAMRQLQVEHGGRVGLDHFRLLRRVGGGDLGNVYLCQIRNPTVAAPPCFYAMKVVDKEALAIRKKLQRADMEKEILGMLDHPFLPTLYAEFDASHYSCLVMEFCPGGDLYATRLRLPSKRFSVSAAKFYAAETLLALEYLHMMGIIYRDLKPENVLVREDGHIMLSDFDLSLKCDVVPKLIKCRVALNQEDDDDDENCAMHSYCSTPSCTRIGPMKPVLSCFTSSTKKTQVASSTKVEQQKCNPELVAEPTQARSKSFVGTHEYLAPEVISGQGHGSAVDWWTFGVFLFELLYGITPFKGENNEKTLINILKKPLSFPRISSVTTKDHEDMVRVQDLISRLLVKNPNRRIGGLKGSTEIKRHEFFKGVNWALIRSVRPPEVPNDCVRSKGLPKLSRKDRDAPYQIPSHFDYF